MEVLTNNMHHLTWDSSYSDVTNALAGLSPSKAIIVGPRWVDVATVGEIGRQLRRGRIEELVTGIYISVQGDSAEMRRTIGLLAAVDACRFAAAAKTFRERNPAPAVGHFVPRRAKRSKLVAHGWGRSSGGPMGCAQIRGLDCTLAESRDFTIFK